jgi:predicted MFS family arabinose efflux permease
MMLGADLGRAILTGLIPIAALLHGPTFVVVLLVAAPMGVLRALFRAGYIASVPAIAGRPQLARANAAFEVVSSTAFIAGPAIAGFLASTIGPGPTLAIDAASFAVSALGLFLIARPLRAPSDRPPARIVDDIREGIGFIVRDPLIRSVVALFAAATMVITALVTALAFRITIDLRLSPAVLGIVLTANGVGNLGGALIASRIGPRTSAAVVLLGSILAWGAALIGIAFVTEVPALLVLAGLTGVAETLLAVTYVTLRTAYSPDRLLGRIGSTARVVSLGLQPIGLLVAGVLIDATSGTTTIAIMGIALILLALAFLSVRALRNATISPHPPQILAPESSPST